MTAPDGVRAVRSMDIYSQALKALAVRCPFGGEEAGGGGAGSASSGGPLLKLPSSGDSKRRNRARKTQQGASNKRHSGDLESGEATNPRMFWSQMDDYFREVSVEDMQLLFPRTRLGLSDPESGRAQDPCLEIRPRGRSYLDVWAEEDRKFRAARDMEALAAIELSSRGLKRKLLTASPVNKRRRTGPAPADLVTLVVSPPEAENEAEDVCHVCYGSDSLDANPILFCDSCNMATHQHCYGVPALPADGNWLCSWCTAKVENRVDASAPFPCVLCTVRGGALKPVGEESEPGKHKRFAHLACSQWIPETYIQDLEAMEPVKNVEGIREERWRLLCVICKQKHGVCIQCSHGLCATAFHPLCARGSKFWMELLSREDGQDVSVESRAYCQRHTAVRLGKPSSVELLSEERSPSEVADEGVPSTAEDRPPAKGKKSLPKPNSVSGNKFSDMDQQELKSCLREVLERYGVPIEIVALHICIEKDILSAWLRVAEQGDAGMEKKLAASVSDWLQTYHSTSTEQNGLKPDKAEAAADSEMVEDPDESKSVDDDKTEARATPFEVPRCAISKAEDWTKENSSSDDIADSSMHEDSPKVDIDSPEMVEATSAAQLVVVDPSEIECESNNVQPYVVPEVLARLEQPCGNLVRLSTSEAEEESHKCNDHRPDEASALKDQWDQLRQAKQLGLLDWFPQDELEGELVILQNQLIDCAQSNCRSSEKLIAKVLARLSVERQAARRIMQDLSVVSQFLADAKEAKKQGRKERRDKEAQAVLAAATAAAAASPRTGYVKRDSGGQDEPYLDDYYKPNWSQSNGSPHPQSSPTVRPLKPPIPRPPRLNISSSSFRLSQTERKSNVQPEEQVACDVCCRSDFTRSNRILQCTQCKVAVHQDCYGVARLPTTGPWFCQPCTETQRLQQTDGDAKPLVPQCALCPNTGGAFRRSTGGGRWVHVFCALWIPETSVGKEQNPTIGGLEAIPVERFNLLCGICQQQQGACVKCNFGHCVGAFHPICAKKAGLYMSVKSVGGGRTNYRAYCEKHSPNQRAKSADSVEPKQCATAEEMTTLKQIRVEFERVRLMCERICKRERIKRELVHCLKDLYVNQLNVVAHGGYAAQQPAAAAVAVAPAENNSPSSNGVWHHQQQQQQAEEESRLAAAEAAATERATAAAAAALESSRPDVATSSSRPPSSSNPEGQVEVPIRESKEQKKPKRYGRHSEPLGREKIMTPSEASMHNKLLPKGYAYVPVDMLEKGVLTTVKQEHHHHHHHPGKGH